VTVRSGPSQEPIASPAPVAVFSLPSHIVLLPACFMTHTLNAAEVGVLACSSKVRMPLLLAFMGVQGGLSFISVCAARSEA
jgi:hypothetical protein